MKTLILTMLLILTLSCSKNNEENSFTPKTIIPTLIGKGDLGASENISPQNTVIYDNTNWNNILNSLQSYTLQQFTETTDVDFTNFQLIAVFDTLYPSPVYHVNITNITENLNNIVVSYEKIFAPSPISEYAQSFIIVKIPKSTKPLVFQLQ
jgi:hypothetical protein